MNSLRQKKNQIHFKAVETPTAWVVLAFAWKIVDGSVVYSAPKVVQVVQKPETALAGDAFSGISEVTNFSSLPQIFLLEGKTAAAILIESGIPSPYIFISKTERTGCIAWQGARPPTVSSIA